MVLILLLLFDLWKMFKCPHFASGKIYKQLQWVKCYNIYTKVYIKTYYTKRTAWYKINGRILGENVRYKYLKYSLDYKLQVEHFPPLISTIISLKNISHLFFSFSPSGISGFSMIPSSRLQNKSRLLGVLYNIFSNY